MIDLYLEIQRASLSRFEYFNVIHLYEKKDSEKFKETPLFKYDKIKELIERKGISTTIYDPTFATDSLGSHSAIKVSVLYNISDILNELISALKEYQIVHQKLVDPKK